MNGYRLVMILLLAGLQFLSAMTVNADVQVSRTGSTISKDANYNERLIILAAANTGDKKRKKRTRARDFDHIATGFPLTGAHMRVDCETCHVNGIFRGTPTSCKGCHDVGRIKTATRKPANHIMTALECDQCHNARTWTGAIYDHSMVVPGTCISCHNGASAPGKPTSHIVTAESCDACHFTRAWLPASFKHIGVLPGTCVNCHNGSTATGKPANHVITASSCDSCHSTRAWLPATFDHANVAPGTCGTCHNGSTATGKPSNHVVTTASCDTCHTTNAWVPAGFDHASVTPGTCSNCHNGSTATGKPGNHFVTTLQCDSCHTTNYWIPTSNYSHTSPLFPGKHNSTVTCINCHTSNSSTITWRFPAYQPECAACHASSYTTGPHKKTEVPTTVFYTVAELKNCTGSCHLYTDNTYTTILQSRSGHHRASAGSF